MSVSPSDGPAPSPSRALQQERLSGGRAGPATASGGGCKSPCPRGAACPSFEEKAFHWLQDKVTEEVVHFNSNLSQIVGTTPREHLLRQFKLIASLLRARVGEIALAAVDDNALSRLADRIDAGERAPVESGSAEPQPSPASAGEGGALPRRPPRHAASRGGKVKTTLRRRRR